MGHKTNPLGLRLGVHKDWISRWFAAKAPAFRKNLLEDIKIRGLIKSKYGDARISKVEIERGQELTVTIHTGRPGVVIGRGGQKVEEMRGLLEKLVGRKVRLDIREIHDAELEANLVAQSVADQLARRVAHRRTMKQAMFRTMQAGAKGVKIAVAGRLGGGEIARRDKVMQGRVPLNTIRADIDYGFAEAHTIMGRIGVKVWIYKGDIMPSIPEEEAAAPAAVSLEEKADASTEESKVQKNP